MSLSGSSVKVILASAIMHHEIIIDKKVFHFGTLSLLMYILYL